MAMEKNQNPVDRFGATSYICSTANPAHLPQNWAKLAKKLFSSKTAPRIFIFSIVLGAEYLSYVKSIETHARPFLTLIILFIGTV